jgi:hypothetical protein
MTPEELAQLIHETYARLAPDYGFEGRRDYWQDAQHQRLMTAVAREVLYRLTVRAVRILIDRTLDK